MHTAKIHECECEHCRNQAAYAKNEEHRLMNLFMSRLNEQERRWYAALEAQKLGHGGLEKIAKITGLHVNTIRRGRNELASDLAERPVNRARVQGGGRKRLKQQNGHTNGATSML
jgi:hypothetical protein